MGYGMGKLEIIEHDGKGGLTFEERPFVVMRDRAFVDLGSYPAKAPAATPTAVPSALPATPSATPSATPPAVPTAVPSTTAAPAGSG